MLADLFLAIVSNWLTLINGRKFSPFLISQTSLQPVVSILLSLLVSDFFFLIFKTGTPPHVADIFCD